MKTNLVSEKLGRITTVEDLVAVSEISLDERELVKGKINKWEVATKNNTTSEVELTELFQITAELKIKHKLLDKDIKQLLLDVFGSQIPTIPSKKYTDGPLLAEIVHTDLHIDRLEHANKKYLESIDTRTMRLFEKLMKHHPDLLVYANLGDYFNSDTNSKTTKGTDQHNYLPEQESFRLGLEHQIRLITTLSSAIPTEVIYVAGNHDYMKLQALADAIDVYFSKSNVLVNAEQKNRKYKRRGNTTLGHAHGNGIGHKDIPQLMQRETKMGKYNYFSTGHHHKKYQEYIGNVLLMQHDSPATPSAWENGHGYVNKGTIDGHLYDKKHGRIGGFSS